MPGSQSHQGQSTGQQSIGPAERSRIAGNWHAVKSDVADAAAVAGRPVSEITIVGVSKYVDAETTGALVDAGCTHLGENRPQSLWEKSDDKCIDARVQWHMIGHLQRNKVRRTLRLDRPPIIHSVDSMRLLQTIAAESDAAKTCCEVLLEVNISGDASKTGLDRPRLEQILSDLPETDSHGGVRVIGLMAMAGWGTDGDQARRQFASLRQLRDAVATKDVPLRELSMGMSGDFVQAIAEGATMVRIGSRLFQGVMDPR